MYNPYPNVVAHWQLLSKSCCSQWFYAYFALCWIVHIRLLLPWTLLKINFNCFQYRNLLLKTCMKGLKMNFFLSEISIGVPWGVRPTLMAWRQKAWRSLTPSFYKQALVFFYYKFIRAFAHFKHRSLDL